VNLKELHETGSGDTVKIHSLELRDNYFSVVFNDTYRIFVACGNLSGKED
jgi:hypothetical protein